MDSFNYKENKLFCENVEVALIAEQVGTPCYIYSYETLSRHFKVFDNAFKDKEHLTCYSVKANSNLSVLNIFKNLGSGFDIVSGGELFRVLKVGADPSKIVYSGVGKTNKEMDKFLDNFTLERLEKLYEKEEFIQKLVKLFEYKNRKTAKNAFLYYIKKRRTKKFLEEVNRLE